MFKKADKILLNSLCSEAENNPRKRKNYNFHKHEVPVQRLYNAFQMGTYISPHLHQGSEKFEFFQWVQGSAGLLIFNQEGLIVSTQLISPLGAFAVEIPGDTWHSIVCLSPNTVVLELKEGPYIKHSAKQRLLGYHSEADYLTSHQDSIVRRQVEATIKNWESLFK